MSAEKWDTDDIPDLTGLTALVTGANSGLGLCSAEALAGHGARVLLACRSPQRGRDALERVKGLASGAEPELVALDLADLASVERAAADVAERTSQLDVLMNNAGVMALPLTRTADGFEAQFGTNHLGHFALDRAAPSPAHVGPGAPGGDHVVAHAPHRQDALGRPQLAARATTSGRPTGSPSWPTCCSPSSSTGSPPPTPSR